MIGALSIIKRVELIDRKEFAVLALNKNKEIFKIHVAMLLIALVISIHSFGAAYIFLLLVDKVVA